MNVVVEQWLECANEHEKQPNEHNELELELRWNENIESKDDTNDTSCSESHQLKVDSHRGALKITKAISIGFAQSLRL